MVELTDHFKERYVERIVGIKDKPEIKRYIAKNKQVIEDNVAKMFSYSELVYSGCIGKSDHPRNFYIVDDIVIVTSTDNKYLITLYRINFNFPRSNKTVINDLVNELSLLRQEREAVVDSNIDEVNRLEDERDRVELEIKFLRDQLDIYHDTKKMITNEIKSKTNSIILIDSKINSYAHQLLHWGDYRRDLLETRSN